MGLVKASGSELKMRQGAWPFYAHSKLLGGTKTKASICLTGDCRLTPEALTKEMPLTAISVKGTLGDLFAIIVNHTSSDQTYQLQVKGDVGKALRIYTPPVGNETALTLDTTLKGSIRVVSPDAVTKAMALMTPTDKGILTIATISTLIIPAYSFNLLEMK